MTDDYTIWHKPTCSTSRFVLTALRDAGVGVVVRDYIRVPPSQAELRGVLASGGMAPRDLLRRKGTAYDELGLGDMTLTDDALIGAMAAHPDVIERPLVLCPDGAAVLCRPKERVFDVLPGGAASCV